MAAKTNTNGKTMQLRGLAYAAAILVFGLGMGCNKTPVLCQSDADCNAGSFCDLGTHSCFQSPGADGGLGWTLSLTSPANDARINASATVTAQLSFGGTTPTLPGTLTLLTSPGTATATLTKNGANTYQGALPAGLTNGQLYTLTASFPSAYSDGGSVLSAPIQVTFDNVAPVFTVSVSPPNRQGNAGPLTTIDISNGFDGGQAFRRDETATVTLTAPDSDVDAGSVQILITGVATPTPAPIALTGLTTCSSATFCRQATLDLSIPALQAFNGYFSVSASGADTAGNASQAAPLPVGVTRWKWSYLAGGGAANIKASPAIGHTGTVYFGTAVGGAFASFYALNPDGTQKWPPAALGSITASPAVGAWDGGSETVYVGANNGAGILYAMNGADGGLSTASGSTYQPASAIDVTGSPAIANVTASAVTAESALFVVKLSGTAGKVVTLRPTDSATVGDLPGVGNVPFGGNVVTNGTDFLFGDSAPRLQGYSIVGASLSALGSGWPSTLPFSVNALALAGPSLVAATSSVGNGSLYKVVLPTNSPASGVSHSDSAAVNNVVVDAQSNAVFVDNNSALADIALSSLPGATSASTTTADAVTGAPVLGAGSHLYTTSSGGTLEAWSSALSGAHDWSIGLAGAVEGSPTLDCSRDGTGSPVNRPGILYVGTDSGKLFAVVVDSHGIDTSAAWPKYQHDPRNTGNSSTALSEFQCP